MVNEKGIIVMVALVTACGILLGTTIYFWSESIHWKQANLDNINIYQRELAEYRPYQNIVEEARKCVNNQTCEGIIITPNRVNATSEEKTGPGAVA